MVKRILVIILLVIAFFSLEQARSVLSDPQIQRQEIPSFQKGYSFLFYGFEGLDDDEYWMLKQTTLIMNRLQKNNVNSVSLVFPFSQASSSASEISTSEDITPSKESMRTFIREAHKRDMVVMLRPIMDESNLEPLSGEWRGNIQPTDKKAWMESYSAMILDYAAFAEEEQVEMFSVGTELPSMLTEKAEWSELIQDVRKVYKGKLLYAFNWNEPFDYGLVGQLDYAGIDSFYPVEEPTPEAWQEWTATMRRYAQTSGKPVLFTEIGTRSQVNSYKTPWAWITADPVDQEAQAAYFRSVCEASTGSVAGWHVWYIDLNSLDVDPATDPTFDPTNKEAEEVIRDCYAGIQ